MRDGEMSTGGEVANALVCKTSIRGFNSRPVLQKDVAITNLTCDAVNFAPCTDVAFHNHVEIGFRPSMQDKQRMVFKS
jgi:hypothetical protein